MTRKEIEEIMTTNQGNSGLFNMEYEDGETMPFSFHQRHFNNDHSYLAMEVNNIWRILVRPHSDIEWEQVIKGKDIVRIYREH